MSGYPGIRASDEDRSRTAAALGEHYGAGRLTLEEFQERLRAGTAVTAAAGSRAVMTWMGESNGAVDAFAAPGSGR